MSLNLQLTLALRSLRGITLHIVPVALNWAIVLEAAVEAMGLGELRLEQRV